VRKSINLAVPCEFFEWHSKTRKMEGRAVFIDPAAESPRDCESGVRTWHVATGRVARTHSSTASRVDPGASLPLHLHSCHEAVVEPERLARCQVEEQSRDLGPNEAVVLDAGPVHRFANAGEGRLRILSTYGFAFATRTLPATGVTQPGGGLK
jgi:putative monooxygenase